MYDRHKALGAVISPFGGFDMPIQYTNIIDEHNAVRHACGVFDVSHMGEIFISGPEAERYVQHIFTNDISGAPIGKIFYGLMLYPSGGAVDDLLVYKLADQHFLLVVNAANIEKDYKWMFENAENYHVTIENKSDEYGQIAVQGPKSEAIVETLLGIPCSGLVFYTFKNTSAEGHPALISRTGYTGEDGFEIYAAPAVIVALWDKLIASGSVTPCGLGCRDTLRFEVGLPLYGNELSADISPLEAGLGIFVKQTSPISSAVKLSYNKKRRSETQDCRHRALGQSHPPARLRSVRRRSCNRHSHDRLSIHFDGQERVHGPRRQHAHSFGHSRTGAHPQEAPRRNNHKKRFYDKNYKK